ncbi:F-box-like domain-containing protein [Legionella sp.]|uniref:F-box-like domain-containing protein n=1 Tax=Legionella sp. TaxID=459 RepID=UPI003CAB714C
MNLPNEVIAYILQFLDVKSLVQVSYVSILYNKIATDRLKWFKLCFSDSVCKTLIEATTIREELLHGSIVARSFYESINTKNIEQIKTVLFSNGVREFLLYAACYEENLREFYPCNTRKLYLTEEIAKKETPNAESVKKWLRVKINVDSAMFDSLYNTQQLTYKKLIPETAIYELPNRIHQPVLKG